ncbi:MAG: LysM domain-containing protein [Rhodocyclaceae bacterium]|nr:LysM domain-containing protein [Rhodocyclaceae bacterium]
MPARIAHIITALIFFFSAAWASAQAPASSPALAENAPDHYTVTAGDTLWGIAGKFLKEPWRWHEIWRSNRNDISNPHRIYPGQILVLDKSGAVPVLKLAQALSQGGSEVKLEPGVHEENSAKPIPSISPRAIAPFLSEPRIVEPESVAEAPRIIGTQENRLYLGVGNLAYVAGIKTEDQFWQVFRAAAPIMDPENGEVLGHEAFYLGSLQMDRPGDPATLRVTSAKREIGEGDLLMPAARLDIPSYVPHAPDKAIEGRVAAIYEGVGETGRNSIVTLNRGKAQGLEVGHVLAIYRDGRLAAYKGASGTDRAKEYQLPAERFGLLFVFRVFERISYALIMDTSRPVGVGDLVRTP